VSVCGCSVVRGDVTCTGSGLLFGGWRGGGGGGASLAI